MCIIAVKPKGQTISKETLQTCWDNNSHGAGMMYVLNGKIHVIKELKSFKKFYNEFKFISDNLDLNIVLHFRIATSGGINDRNIHPFKISDNAFFCHNGILDIDVPKDSKDNDTRIFNNLILKQLPIDFYNNPAILQLIEMSIGYNNKFVILDKEGDYHILNEDAGQWSDGCWFSNGTFNSYRYTNKNSKWDRDDWFYNSKSQYSDDWDFDEVKYPCDECGQKFEAAELCYLSDYNVTFCKECESLYQDIIEEDLK